MSRLELRPVSSARFAPTGSDDLTPGATRRCLRTRTLGSISEGVAAIAEGRMGRSRSMETGSQVVGARAQLLVSAERDLVADEQ